MVDDQRQCGYVDKSVAEMSRRTLEAPLFPNFSTGKKEFSSSIHIVIHIVIHQKDRRI
jgi:hypothetical protein